MIKSINSAKWLLAFVLLVIGSLAAIGIMVYTVDPYFHYHKPYVDKYFYCLDNQRSQNDGIVKHFDYDAVITGTSMSENFKASEADKLFGTNSIKVPSMGASYKETCDMLNTALKYNPDIKLVICSLDMHKFFNDKDLMRTDLGDYPTYLYDSNPFNDVRYLYNRNIIHMAAAMAKASKQDDFTPGITSFDDYSRWQEYCKYGVNAVLNYELPELETGEAEPYLTDTDKKTIRENIEQNVISLAYEHPEVDFYYFITPFSVVFWQTLLENGRFNKQIEAEQYIIELILECDNIKLFSFNNRFDITTDLNNYKDKLHYGGWINSLMLRLMHDEKYLLTKANYKSYIEQERDFYLNYDYGSIIKQEDYDDDLIAAVLLETEISLTE